ncbi:hypothetical protein FOXG_17875 [Fusarium oxysporum f. sp. lycopersici 4287]|uniref:Uncharacterized protein n=2 Tax=Fusarium oxysporum TaxID=5507 RepID=A0A0J9U685_FUSO4|nr:hypothetical protein FOXG_17875 [Fusarium oxysporum f. sp. lycopersici 4287]EXK47942.1 hypothetical protein FOMG_01127 [Fusarium oxysporum f. sp. melonis 26406]KNA94332.1 hypothetical protein FOXG_17875 [Fusarium oxysporum f. sp. lycopersici 4287]
MGVSSGIEARFVWNESLASRHGWITTAFCSEITAVLQNMSMPVPSPSTSIPVAWLNAVL